LADQMLATIEARAVMYAGQMAEGRTWAVKDAAEEKAAIPEGFSQEDGTRQLQLTEGVLCGETAGNKLLPCGCLSVHHSEGRPAVYE
jgi:hypothetical protein